MATKLNKFFKFLVQLSFNLMYATLQLALDVLCMLGLFLLIIHTVYALGYFYNHRAGLDTSVPNVTAVYVNIVVLLLFVMSLLIYSIRFILPKKFRFSLKLLHFHISTPNIIPKSFISANKDIIISIFHRYIFKLLVFLFCIVSSSILNSAVTTGVSMYEILTELSILIVLMSYKFKGRLQFMKINVKKR